MRDEVKHKNSRYDTSYDCFELINHEDEVIYNQTVQSAITGLMCNKTGVSEDIIDIAHRAARLNVVAYRKRMDMVSKNKGE